VPNCPPTLKMHMKASFVVNNWDQTNRALAAWLVCTMTGRCAHCPGGTAEGSGPVHGCAGAHAVAVIRA